MLNNLKYSFTILPSGYSVNQYFYLLKYKSLSKYFGNLYHWFISLLISVFKVLKMRCVCANKNICPYCLFALIFTMKFHDVYLLPNH